MRIASGDVSLTAARRFKEDDRTYSMRGIGFGNVLTDKMKGKEGAVSKQKDNNSLSLTKDGTFSGTQIAYGNYSQETSGASGVTGGRELSLLEQVRNIRMQILNSLLDFLRKNSGGKSTSLIEELAGQVQGIGGSYMVEFSQDIYYHEEEEETSFQGQGVAITEDGREICFDVNLSMSRSFVEYTEIQTYHQTMLLDPLVIHVGADVSEISDQNFYFDLDCDGKEEKLSNLSAGSGFLALDKNGDGIINDGSELFGAKSGNGFADLEAYDTDGNGWIDENDAIYTALKVFIRDANGQDRLMTLKEADVGAIFLGRANTQFTQQNMNGDTKGVVRQSGIFLKESGGTGFVQQIDLAVKNAELKSALNTTQNISRFVGQAV